MPLDPAFVEDCPYGPDGLFVDELLEVDPAGETGHGRVVLRAPTHPDLPITRTQRVHPTRHPAHVSGGLMIHMTGIAGFAHAYYVLGLRHRDGWTGYGAKIASARFRELANVTDPLILDCSATQVRRGASRIVARYRFLFRQGERTVYESDQTAMFILVAD